MKTLFFFISPFALNQKTVIVDDENKEPFFSKKATLAVTGQLHGEAYATGFSKIYTFGPTFRAEKSNTKRHAAEF